MYDACRDERGKECFLEVRHIMAIYFASLKSYERARSKVKSHLNLIA